MKSALFEGVGHFRRIFQREAASPINHCWCQKARVIALSCDIKISAVRNLVLSQYADLTKRRTDRRTDRRTELREQYRALHYMQMHGKKQTPFSVVSFK